MTQDEIRRAGAEFTDWLLAQPSAYQQWIATAPYLEAVAPIVKEVAGLAELPTSEEAEQIEYAAMDYAAAKFKLGSMENPPPMLGTCIVQHRIA